MPSYFGNKTFRRCWVQDRAALMAQMNHIVNNLWLGSQHDADVLGHDNPEKITAILNVRGVDAYNPPGRDQAAEHPGMAYKWIPAPDNGTVSPEHLREALDWLQEQTDRGERILVHCRHGISRSPAFLAAFMVESGISSSLEGAKATISAHRLVYPASLYPSCHVDRDCKRTTQY
jgi:protein tyrosine phosphatase (PTP) superfamily phosphohydrolase (DUF442 family)